MGKLSNLFRCGGVNSFRKDDAWAYDFYHIESAHHCMTDAAGGLSVDYLIRWVVVATGRGALAATCTYMHMFIMVRAGAGMCLWSGRGERGRGDR